MLAGACAFWTSFVKLSGSTELNLSVGETVIDLTPVIQIKFPFIVIFSFSRIIMSESNAAEVLCYFPVDL